MIESRLVLFCRLFDRRSRTTSCFFFFEHCVRQHMYTHAAYLHLYLHTLCRFMQYRLIDTVSAAYPAQGPANYLLYILQCGHTSTAVSERRDDVNKLHYY